MNSQRTLAIIVAFSVMTFGLSVLPTSIQEAQANPCANEISRGGSADNVFNPQDKDDRECDFTRYFDFEEEIGSEDIEEESATLSVCKEMSSSSAFGFEPDDFAFTVIGNGPDPDGFLGDANCVEVSIGPGGYTVSEVFVPGGGFTLTLNIDPTSDCMLAGGLSAIGEIHAGETEECTFINTVGD